MIHKPIHLRRPRIGLVALLLLCVPREAEACQACLDTATQLQFPFLQPLICFFLGWIVCSHAIKIGARMRVGPTVADGSALWLFTWLGILALVLGPIMLLFHVAALPIVVAWVAYLTYSSVLGLRGANRIARRPQRVVNATFLVVALTVIPAAYARARTVDSLVSWLGHSPPHFPVTGRVIRDVIHHQQAAVAPLTEAVSIELQESRGPYSYRMGQLCYCLNRIGGKQAEQVLKDVVVERVAEGEVFDLRWKAIACCSYAECAQGESVPALINLHETATGPDGDFLKTIALCALVRSADGEAVEYVLQRAGQLMEGGQTPGPRWYSELPHRTLRALLQGRGPKDLRFSPIYGPMSVGINEEWLGDVSPLHKTSISWDTPWVPNVDQVDAARKHWMSLLK